MDDRFQEENDLLVHFVFRFLSVKQKAKSSAENEEAEMVGRM